MHPWGAGRFSGGKECWGDGTLLGQLSFCLAAFSCYELDYNYLSQDLSVLTGLPGHSVPLKRCQLSFIYAEIGSRNNKEVFVVAMGEN